MPISRYVPYNTAVGPTPAKKADNKPKETLPYDSTKKRNWDAEVKPKPAEIDATAICGSSQPAEEKPEEPTIKLENAVFLPDDKTDFNKPCKIQVDVIGDKPGAVTFELWAKYDNEDHDLKCKANGDTVKGKATAELKLFYVDQHCDDLHNGKPDATSDYYAKISTRGAKPVESKPLTMPRKKDSASVSDSVGQGGKNKPDDVKLVKKKLKELGYPVKDESEKVTDEDIKAIKFFQTFNWAIPQGLVKVDGRIDKGGKTEKALLGETAKKYDPPKKTDIKPLEASIEKKKNDAINGTDKDLKERWQKIMDVWNEVSPYLPEGTTMASGFRTKDEQRKQMQTKYRQNIEKIKKKFPDEAPDDILESSESETDGPELDELDKKMHSQICEAVSPNEVALPGKSKHESGKAIDTQVSDADSRARALLWLEITDFGTKIQNIIKESNSCVHFEFI